MRALRLLKFDDNILAKQKAERSESDVLAVPEMMASCFHQN